jgi:hypothetical protein
MALLGDPVEFNDSRANENTDRAGARTTEISIARCRELLGEEAEYLTDREIAEIRSHAEAMACIVIELYEAHRRIFE